MAWRLLYSPVESEKDSMEETERPLAPLTERQREWIRLMQGLSADSRHTLTVAVRGQEPWEVQTLVEHRKLGRFKPRT